MSIVVAQPAALHMESPTAFSHWYRNLDMTEQLRRIVECLLETPNGWTPLPKILALKIAQYNARFFEARRKGFVIENRTARVGCKRYSWFRIVVPRESEAA